MLEDLETLIPSRDKHDCKLNRLMESLEPSDKSILTNALNDQVKWSTHALHVALRKKGFEIGYQSIYRHRKGACACWNKNA